MGNPHVLALPYPAQGHVISLMELSQTLTTHGFKVTFVNTDFNHQRVMNSLAKKDQLGDQIRLVSISDGLEPSADRNDLRKLTESILCVMPGQLEELIKEINRTDNDRITCIITDQVLGWALEIAEKMGIQRAAYCTTAASMVILGLSIPKLIKDGIVDDNGTPIKNQMFQLSPTMPAMNTAHFVWSCIGDSTTQKFIFHVMLQNVKTAKLAEWLICNSAYDLEPAAFTLASEIIPIGPLLASNRFQNSAGHFWREESGCLKWLDQQPSRSVVYVAFGSFTVFDQTQFQELALGLEICNRPFLWVVRPDITSETQDAYPEGFHERVATRAQMVGWAPQQKVLGHPSVACFLSHCGWNSTMEGVSNGVPILCWPYFADQFLNETYICDGWKVGLRFNRDEHGIITRHEIKNKVEQLLGDETFTTRASDLKQLTRKNVTEGGCSYENFRKFIEWIKSKKSSSI